MPVDVEQQLAALGRLWNETIVHVETSEIVSHGTARRHPAINGIDGLAVATTPDQPRATQQFTEEGTMIELETPNQTEVPRNGSKRVLVGGLLAAAAVAAIALVAIRNDDPVSPAPADQPAPTVTVLPTTPPQPLFGPTDAPLAPGTYLLDEVQGTPTTPILVTVGAGWSTFDNWAIMKEEPNDRANDMAITFGRPVGVVLDACHPGEGDHPGPLTSLDGIVTALREQGGWVDVTAPFDISIDGYAGKAFQRATPADLSGCTDGNLTSGEDPAESSYPPGDTETVWVLDLDGTFIVVESRARAAAAAEVHAELAAVLESIRIAP
jgi:hypothetical protein